MYSSLSIVKLLCYVVRIYFILGISFIFYVCKDCMFFMKKKRLYIFKKINYGFN